MAALPGRGRGRHRVPGGALLRPTVLATLVVLIVNDHWAKAHFAGTVTGKLSDVAGLYLFPFVLVALAELQRWLRSDPSQRQAPASWSATRAETVAAAGATAVGFAAVKLLPAAGSVYADLVAAIRWVLRAAPALLTGRRLPEVQEVQHVMDPTDLLALPVVLLTLVAATFGGHHIGGTTSSPRPRTPRAGTHRSVY